jgi:phospholipid-transporting ATPase
MFYKNALFVTAQFWFGFENVFSGQTLYESFIYQGYNLCFTAFPIMWWAIYDMQHTKQELVANPKLYEIGLKNQCFSTMRFFENILNGVVNGLFLFLFCFYGEDGNVVSSQAKNGWFWIDGTMVYAAVVLVVNIKMAHVTNTHTWASTLIIVASVLLFWGWLGMESVFSVFPDVYRIFK